MKRSPPVLSLLAAAGPLIGCESTEPGEKTFDVPLEVECANCDAPGNTANLRVTLSPATALVGDTILSDQYTAWNEWRLIGTGTELIPDAFTGVEAGWYVITAASPYPAELGGACRVEAADTVINSPRQARAGRLHYPWVWPYVTVIVPDAGSVPGLRLSC